MLTKANRTPAVIAGASALILLALWGVTLERIDHERDQTEESIVRENDNLALAYEQHTIRTFEAIDQAVRVVRYEYEEEGEELQLDKVFAETWLAAPLFQYAAIVDANGIVVKNSHNRVNFDISDRPFMALHRSDRNDRLHIGAPSIARIVRTPTLQVTRRISGPDGSFRGVALVAVDPERLADFQQLINLGANGVIQLIGLDGIARVRRHGSKTSFGEDMRKSQVVARALEVPVGNFVTRGNQDGEQRLLSYRRLERYPFVVGIGRSMDEAFADFHRTAGLIYGIAAAGTLLVLAFAAAALAMQARQARAGVEKARSDDRLRESEERFRQMAAAIREVFWLIDPQTNEVLYMSPAYEQVWGAPWAGRGSWLRSVHPQDRERMAQAGRAVRSTGRNSEEYRIVRPDGTVRWIRDRAYPILRDGQVYRIAGIAEDISGARLAGEALRESEARFRSLTELSSDFYWESDAGHRLVQRGSYGKRSSVSLFERGDQLGKRRWEVPYLSPDEAGWAAHRAVLDAHEPFRGFEISRPGDDGSERFISLSGDPIFAEGGAFLGYRGVGTDITQRKVAELELRESERRFREMLGKVQLVSIMLDREARITYCNDYLLQLTGWTREELLGADWFERFVPPELGELHGVFAELLKDDPGAWHHENEILTRSGERRLVRWNNTVLRAASGEVIGVSSIGEDITDQRRAEARYKATFEQSGVGVVHASLEGRFLRANRKFAAMLGYEPGEIAGMSFEAVTHGEDRATTASAAERLRGHDESFVPEYENRYVRKDGSIVWTAVSISLVRDAREMPEYFIAMVRDISARKAAEAKLAYQAHYDALTELPNRALFNDRLAQAHTQAKRKLWSMGVLCLDLDRFKALNDTLGAPVGDALLKETGERLAAAVRPGDTVARLGGDQFGVLLAELAAPGDAAIVTRKVTDALARPYDIAGHQVFVSASIGVATFPQDGDAESLVNNAEAAMFRAKDLGRNLVQFYAEGMNARAAERLELEADLRRALEARELTLYYQPKVSLVTGKVTGFEALMRWPHRTRGMVSPGVFVPILEETGLIHEAGKWAIDYACAQLRAWRDAGLAPVPVAVNLSARQFLHHGMRSVIEEALRRHEVEPSLLEVEITESDAMRNPQEVSAVLEAIRAHGCSIAVDDFGTGYSSLAYLKRLPLDTLKIDRSFISGLPGNLEDAAIARAVIAMAHRLGLKVVAEGVETEEQRIFLAINKCDEMQGFLFSKPLPAAQCDALLAQALVCAA